MSKKIASIPEPPKNADPSLRSFLAAVKEALEVRLGRRGDPLEEAITKRELVDSGIARLRPGQRGDLLPTIIEPPGASTVPPPLLGVRAIGVHGGITLTFESPAQQYGVHAYVEIWRSDEPDPETRVLLDASRGNSYFDRVPEAETKTYYYWLRSVSEYGRQGGFSEMLTATKPADTRAVLESIGGMLDESALNEAFRADFDGMKNAIASHDQRLSQQGTSILQQTAILEGLSASWTLTMNVNGYVSGVASHNDGKRADFAILADNFWIATPTGGKIKAFATVGNTAYLDSAVIRDGSIQEGKLGSISFGKLRDAYGNPVVTVGGKLRADMIDVTTLQVTDANIAGVLKSNATGSNGQPRWVLDKNGGLAFNSSTANGRVEIGDSGIRMWYPNGQLMLRLGG